MIRWGCCCCCANEWQSKRNYIGTGSLICGMSALQSYYFQVLHSNFPYPQGRTQLSFIPIVIRFEWERIKCWNHAGARIYRSDCICRCGKLCARWGLSELQHLRESENWLKIATLQNWKLHCRKCWTNVKKVGENFPLSSLICNDWIFQFSHFNAVRPTHISLSVYGMCIDRAAPIKSSQIHNSTLHFFCLRYSSNSLGWG